MSNFHLLCQRGKGPVPCRLLEKKLSSVSMTSWIFFSASHIIEEAMLNISPSTYLHVKLMDTNYIYSNFMDLAEFVNYISWPTPSDQNHTWENPRGRFSRRARRKNPGEIVSREIDRLLLFSSPVYIYFPSLFWGKIFVGTYLVVLQLLVSSRTRRPRWQMCFVIA